MNSWRGIWECVHLNYETQNITNMELRWWVLHGAFTSNKYIVCFWLGELQISDNKRLECKTDNFDRVVIVSKTAYLCQGAVPVGFERDLGEGQVHVAILWILVVVAMICSPSPQRIVFSRWFRRHFVIFIYRRSTGYDRPFTLSPSSKRIRVGIL